MADYLYSVAIQANSFHNNMADKTGRLTGGRLMNIHCSFFACTCVRPV